MHILQGQYNVAKVFSPTLDPSVKEQVLHLLNQPFVEGSKIRIMPDAHAGAGCTIGTTMTFQDKVVPNLVGVDIGCGMETICLGQINIDFARLDRIIRRHIPSGFNIRSKAHRYSNQVGLERLRCLNAIDLNRAHKSIGTLGGGNHFIEIGHDHEDRLFLIIHSGSRHLGLQIATHYQKMAAQRLSVSGKEASLAYCQGSLLNDYLHDSAIAELYADLNRKAMASILCEHLNLNEIDRWTTVHNYIDRDARIIRKGAVSARQGERILIPINMRDGSLVANGKGNCDWNESAPHGAGRLMSRRQAHKTISLENYKQSMEGIYSSTVNRKTIDEAAFAYKPLEEILSSIAPSVDVITRLRPLFNFKAAD